LFLQREVLSSHKVSRQSKVQEKNFYPFFSQLDWTPQKKRCFARKKINKKIMTFFQKKFPMSFFFTIDWTQVQIFQKGSETLTEFHSDRFFLSMKNENGMSF